jgi:hypothetical protein
MPDGLLLEGGEEQHIFPESVLESFAIYCACLIIRNTLKVLQLSDGRTQRFSTANTEARYWT